MKKLINREFSVTVFCALVYFAGLYCGLTPHRANLAAAVVAAVGAAVAVVAVAATTTTSIAAITTAFTFVVIFAIAAVGAAVAIATTAFDFTFAAAGAAIITAVAAFAIVASSELTPRYRWVFLSFVLEETAIYFVMRYGHLIFSR